MKILIISSMMFLSCFAEYQQGNIDMHGGKETYVYDKKKVLLALKLWVYQYLWIIINLKILRRKTIKISNFIVK